MDIYIGHTVEISHGCKIKSPIQETLNILTYAECRTDKILEKLGYLFNYFSKRLHNFYTKKLEASIGIFFQNTLRLCHCLSDFWFKVCSIQTYSEKSRLWWSKFKVCKLLEADIFVCLELCCFSHISSPLSAVQLS